MRLLYPHLCRYPMLILLREETWGHMDAYSALWEFQATHFTKITFGELRASGG